MNSGFFTILNGRLQAKINFPHWAWILSFSRSVSPSRKLRSGFFNCAASSHPSNFDFLETRSIFSDWLSDMDELGIIFLEDANGADATQLAVGTYAFCDASSLGSFDGPLQTLLWFFITSHRAETSLSQSQHLARLLLTRTNCLFTGSSGRPVPVGFEIGFPTNSAITLCSELIWNTAKYLCVLSWK